MWRATVIGLLGIACGCAAQQPAGASAAAPYDAPLLAAPDRPGPDFDLIDFDVSVTPDLATGAISGVTTLMFRSLVDDLRVLTLSGNSLAVTGIGPDVRAVSNEGEAMTVSLTRPLSRGEVSSVRLQFSGMPSRGLTRTERLVHTGYFACDWMPCAQDRPGDKATVTLTLNLPATAQSIGPGERVAMEPLRDGVVAHRWRLDRPYPAYLIAFAAGDWVEVQSRVGDVTLSILGADGSPEALSQTLSDTAAMLSFFEARAGAPFPHPSYTQLVVPGGAAQEAATHSTLGWEGLRPILEDPTEDWLPAHELAHQWWGNLVTNATWTDLWLNEGVTTFMVAAWKEHRWGRAAYEREMSLARRRVEAARAAGVDVGLTFAGPYPSLPLRRAITYSKGALFMDALRTELGEDRFWTGLNTWTRTYAGGAASSADFQRVMEQAAGRSLKDLFDSWI